MTFKDKVWDVIPYKLQEAHPEAAEIIVERLTAAHQEAVIEELESIIKQFGISSSIPDHTVGMSIILNRIATLKKGQENE